MTVTQLADARPRTALLSQHLVTCPCCGSLAAAHVDPSGGAVTLVRFVCVRSCVPAADDVLATLGPVPRMGEPAA